MTINVYTFIELNVGTCSKHLMWTTSCHCTNLPVVHQSIIISYLNLVDLGYLFNVNTVTLTAKMCVHEADYSNEIWFLAEAISFMRKNQTFRCCWSIWLEHFQPENVLMKFYAKREITGQNPQEKICLNFENLQGRFGRCLWQPGTFCWKHQSKRCTSPPSYLKVKLFDRV